MAIKELTIGKDLDYEYNLLMTALHVSVSKHLLDENFTVVWANDYFYERTLYTKEEYERIYRNNCSAYFRQMPEEYEKFAREIRSAIAEKRSGYESVCRMPQKGGGYIWIKIVGKFSEERIDGVPVIYSTFTDVTDAVEQRQLQKKLEERGEQLAAALAEAERANRAKSDFLSSMSHDIRTPMNAILGMTAIAQAHTDNREKVTDCLKKIAVSGQHLLGLINDVLDMSKIESGKMSLNMAPVSLPELTENVVAIVQPRIKEREQKFSVGVRGVCHEHVLSDALRLRQIFINILSNACKFTPFGGNIAMTIAEKPSARAGYSDFEFVFTDDGIGMQPEFLERIYEPFGRERDSRVDGTEGSGLGMAITKRLVELLEGAIEVESAPDRGTRFTVRIPMKREEMPEWERLPDCSILVADDDPVVCECAAEKFAKMGIRADFVHNGVDAVAKAAEAQARGRAYDAVILDWQMPGLNGLDAARRIRKESGATSVLITSAYDWSDAEGQASDAGVDGFLAKPIFFSTLCGAIQKYVLKRPEKAAAQKDGFDFRGKHFLIAEDNQINLEIAREILADTGAQLTAVGDGRVCAEAFERAPAGTFDLILMDIQMPGLNGYDSARRIRASGKADARRIPILAMTADAFAEDIQAAFQAGMDEHIAKPLDWKALCAAAQRLLDGGRRTI